MSVRSSIGATVTVVTDSLFDSLSIIIPESLRCDDEEHMPHREHLDRHSSQSFRRDAPVDEDAGVFMKQSKVYGLNREPHPISIELEEDTVQGKYPDVLSYA